MDEPHTEYINGLYLVTLFSTMGLNHRKRPCLYDILHQHPLLIFIRKKHTMLIRNGNNKISVAATNGYTIERVKKAIEFVKKANRRTTPIIDYLNLYNELRGTNETLPSCKACGATKYIAGVENYAKYGYLTLINKGIDPKELDPTLDTETTQTPQTITNQANRIVIPTTTTEEVAKATQKKRGRKPNANATNKR